MSSNAAPLTSSQLTFIQSLLDERAAVLEIASVDTFIKDQGIDQLTKSAASALIDKLRQVPKYVAPVPTAETVMRASGPTNAYPGRCVECGVNVVAGAGWREKRGGSWVVHHHSGDCQIAAALAQGPAKVEEAPKLKVVTVGEGIYSLDGDIYKVVTSQVGRLYAKLLMARPSGEWSDGSDKFVAEWVYSAGAMAQLTPEMKLSHEDAAAFGSLYNFCCNCGRELSDERSIVAGYGPTCAENHGWPYPTAAEAAAKITPQQALRAAEAKAAKK